MAKDDVIEMTGEVVEKLPDTKFRVKLDNGHTILCTISGKMKKFNVWVAVGDMVKVEMTPYDLDKGRIIFREKAVKTPANPNPQQNKR